MLGKIKTIEEFEADVLARFRAENKPAEDTERAPTQEELFFIREIAMLNHFIAHSLTGAQKQLEQMNRKINAAIEKHLGKDIQ